MPTIQDFYDALSGFNSEYQINVSIDPSEISSQKMAYLDKFLFEKDSPNPMFTTYADKLATAAVAYMEQKTRVSAGYTVDMSDVSLGKFIEDFENVMQTRHLANLEEDQEPTRAPFEGESFAKAVNAMLGRIGRFNKPLHGVWADKLSSGKLNVDQLREFTTAENAKIDAENFNPDTQMDPLKNVVAAQRAMDAYVSKRSAFAWLNVFAWPRYFRENSLRDELNARVEAYRNAGVPTESATSDTSLLAGTVDKLKETAAKYKSTGAKATVKAAQPDPRMEKKIQKDMEKLRKVEEKKRADAEKKKQKETQAQKKANAKKPDPKISQAQAKDLLFDNDKNREMNEQYGELLDEASVSSFARRTVLISIGSGMKTKIGAGWDKFAAATTPDAKNAAMHEMAMSVFGQAFWSLAMDVEGMEAPAMFALAQKITDLALKAYSPAEPGSKYEAYGDKYFVQNAEAKDLGKLVDRIGYKGDLGELMNSTKVELGLSKESFSIPGLAETVNVANPNEKVQQTKAPVKGRSID